jgi:hypothetical protein
MLNQKNGIENVSFAGLFRGTVINNVDDAGEAVISVVIPKLMMNFIGSEKPTPANSKEPLDKSIVKNKDENSFNSNVQIVNFFRCRPSYLINTSPSEKSVTSEVEKDGGHQTVSIGSSLKHTSYKKRSGEYRVPKIGTTVLCYFEDEDPQKPRYFPFTPSLDGEVIAMSNVESQHNVEAMEKKVNIDVIREQFNGNVIYLDENDDRNTFVIKFANGHRIKIEDNAEASSVVIDTQYGHQFKMVDKSSSRSSDNTKDSNNEDGINGGKFIKIQTPKGQEVLLDDNDGKEKVLINTMTGHKVLMDDVADLINIHTGSGTIIDLLQGSTINISTADLISAKAATVNISGSNNVGISGTSKVEVSSSALVSISAPKIELK